MKKLLMIMTMFAAVAFTTTSANAQNKSTDLLASAFNLVNVQVGSVQVGDVLTDVITIGDVNVNVEDVTVKLVDIQNSLNNNDIDVLNNFLNNLTIDNVLNNLLRDAEIITGNQIVVGILSNGTILIANATGKTKKK